MKAFRFLIVLTGMVILPLSSSALVRIELGSEIESRILDQQVKVSIILPEAYYTSRDSYPVVYLLHGFGGDQNSWIKRCRINYMIDSLLTVGAIDDCIYILPDAGNSYFINNYDSTYCYADFFSGELVPWVDSLYRTIPEKHARALLGLSMGGFGSIVLALKYPDVFGIVVALSAAVRTEEIFKDLPQKKYETNFAKVYGPGLSPEERITEHWKDNSPFYIIDSVSAGLYTDINWYIDCGQNDFLLPANEAFHDLLRQYNIPHEYHVRPGTHNWEYWESGARRGFIFIHTCFNQ